MSRPSGLPNGGTHDYAPSDSCTNWDGHAHELVDDDDEGCAHRRYRRPHCAWCGNQQDMGWHTERSR